MTSGGVLTPDFQQRYEIDASSQYDLVATSTSDPEPYCGTYECVDDNGAGGTASAIVTCKHFVALLNSIYILNSFNHIHNVLITSIMSK